MQREREKREEKVLEAEKVPGCGEGAGRSQLNVSGQQHQPVGCLRDLNKTQYEITKTNIAKDSNDINSPLFNIIWRCILNGTKYHFASKIDQHWVNNCSVETL